ncbi:MAG: hypothetical protein ACRDTG_18395 [Pseudonocardiaceae bacterium]
MLLIDACVAINLVATDHLDEIASTLCVTFFFVRQAADEVGELREMFEEEMIVTPIDLSKYASSALHIIDLRPVEYALYVELAASVGDGEAATIAVAHHRSLPLATDDRKARKVCGAYLVPEPMRTLALLHAYVGAVPIAHDQARELLLRVRRRASFRPPRADPNYDWWTDLVGDN